MSKINVDRALADIPEIRHRATILCYSNPALWTAVHGVSLGEYLRGLLDLEETLLACKKKGVVVLDHR